MRRVLVLSLLVIIGCSKGTLDRKTAEDQINQEFSNRRERIPVRIGRVGSHCESLTQNGKTFDVDISPTKDFMAVIASAGGYITSVPDGKDFWKVSLTDKGREFVKANHVDPRPAARPNHCGYELYDLPLATARVVEVTGIIPGQSTAQVEFTWNWSLTELGKGLRADGDIYHALTELQRDGLQDWSDGNPDPSLPVPLPS